MLNNIYRSILLTLILGIILCGAYPLLIYGVSNLIFHEQATGGIFRKKGIVIGAKIIGQKFSKPEYFHGRPSAAGNNGYDASNSSGSNLGPTNQKLYDTLKGNAERFLNENPQIRNGEIPTDIITSSGSGLDPHISTEAAFAQIPRVATSRKVNIDELRAVVQNHIEGPQLGIFGEPVINVLTLNLDLDERFPLGK